MPTCPSCNRPVVSKRFQTCLYCGEPLPEDVLKQIEPLDVHTIEQMLQVQRIYDSSRVEYSYTVARWIYATAACLGLMLTFATLYYTIRHAILGIHFALFVTSFLLTFVVFAIYKAFRPQPMTRRFSPFRR